MFIPPFEFIHSFIHSYYNLQESAGDAGFIVSGLIQSDGDGDLSRLVTWPIPSDIPVQCPRLSERCPILVE